MSSDDSEWGEEDLKREASSLDEDESFQPDDDDDDNSEENAADEDKKPAARKTKATAQKKRKTIMLAKQAAEEEEEEAAAASKAASGSKKSKYLRRVDFDAMDDQIDLLPSQDRLTNRGGYMHTKGSRMKISKGNAGNVPWNKGKNRSEDAKAKISAGVRARNRAILLVKLSKLGLTEDEWFQKKKQLKVVREKVRKARLAVAKYQENKKKNEPLKQKSTAKLETAQQQLDSLEQELKTDDEEEEDAESDGKEVSAGSVPTSSSNVLGTGRPCLKRTNEFKLTNVSLFCLDPQDSAADATSKEKKKNETAAPVPRAAAPLLPNQQPSITLFARDLNWTQHVFDKSNISYSMLCPHGGPGGLVCCESCTSTYSNFLSKTAKDMETQRIANLGSEVKELIQFSRDAKSRLSESVKATRRKPVPPHRRTASATASAPATASPPKPGPAAATAAAAASASGKAKDGADVSSAEGSPDVMQIASI